jgi:hypothetical protein
VQILVVVANTQARTLWTEVEKGFARTAVGRELVGPKVWVNPVKKGMFIKKKEEEEEGMNGGGGGGGVL